MYFETSYVVYAFPCIPKFQRDNTCTYTYIPLTIDALPVRLTRPSASQTVLTHKKSFIPEGVAEFYQTHVLPKLLSHEKHCRHDRW
jgi:hypothetical protein